jgi:AcrR family transcriptional regulator
MRIAMESTLSERNVVKRPGGRTAEVTARIHQAVIGLIVEGGVAACTVSAVAERAGIERSTLYRRFPDRWAAIIEALTARAGADIMPDLEGSFVADLRSTMRRLRDTLESPYGAALLAVIGALHAASGGEHARTFLDIRMAQLAPMFDAAIARGELAADVDREALIALGAGPIYFRMFVAARRAEDAFIERIIESVCAAFCRSGAAKVPLPADIA